MPDKEALYHENPTEFIKTENQKLENIHNGWFGIKVFWTVFILVGIALIFFYKNPLRLGISVGILIIGTLGQLEEAISYHHNARYRVLINAKYAKNEVPR